VKQLYVDAAARAAARLPLPESDDEKEPSTVYTEVEIADQTFYWDESTGNFYSREEDGSYTEAGTYDGITFSFSP